MRDADGLILVYSVVERSTFDAIMPLAKKIQELKDDTAFRGVIVGNQADLGYERQVGMNGEPLPQ